MTSRKPVLAVVSLMLLATVAPWSPAEASIVAESDTHYRCSELGREVLPKKITILQVIDDRFFTTAPNVAVEVFATYPFRFDVDKGKVIVTGVVVKPDGTETSLPKLVGRMRFGDANKLRSTNLLIERGDIIEWKVKLKGLAPLSGMADCFWVEVGVVGSELTTFQSGIDSLSARVRSKK